MTTDTANEPLKIAGRYATGPLRFPPAELTYLARKVSGTLSGAATSPDWIPEGLSPELDTLREHHLRVRNQCAAQLTALDDLARSFRREDADYAEKLRKAAVDGRSDTFDGRTPEADREAEKKPVLERLWANVEVLADVCDQVVDTLRQQKAQVLAGCRADIEDLKEQSREAERARVEARDKEWLAHRLRQWVIDTATDNTSFGRQPAPELGPMPTNVNPRILESSYARSWAQPNLRADLDEERYSRGGLRRPVVELPTVPSELTDEEIDALSGKALDDACDMAGIDTTDDGGSVSADEKRAALRKGRGGTPTADAAVFLS